MTVPSRVLVEASAAYCPDAFAEDDRAKPWSVAVRVSGEGDLEFQGWGPDPLAAALQCAEEVYFALLKERAEPVADERSF